MAANTVLLKEHLELAAEAKRTMASLRAWIESAGGSMRERELLLRSLRDRERRLDRLAGLALAKERERSLFDADTPTQPVEAR